MLDADILHLPQTRRLTNRKATYLCALGAVIFLVVVIVAGQMVTGLAMQTDFLQKNLPPSMQHPFGTDWMGRDMFARTLAGLSLSIVVGLGAAMMSSVIALVLGLIAALGGRRADAVVAWMIDLMMGIPHIVLLILISCALGGGFVGVMVGVAFTHWASLTRVVRAEVMQCKNSDFVSASLRLGRSKAYIALKHMLAHVAPQFLVGLILMFPHAILHEAAITFLGFGIPPEQPALGIILSESMGFLSTGMWWLAVFPGIALIVCVLLFDLVGSSVRKLIDPASSQE